jgi:hypothetical protein
MIDVSDTDTQVRSYFYTFCFCICNLCISLHHYILDYENINIHLQRCGQFYWWRKPEYPVKTTDLSQDNVVHVSSTPRHERDSNSQLV